MNALHPWNISPKDAIALQKELALAIKLEPLKQPIRYVAGLDCAFGSEKKYCFSVCVLWDLHTKSLIETQVTKLPLTFPYVPGLLSFREAPAMLQAYNQLTGKPDLIMVDGHGIAHPRGLGIAAHIGLWLQTPTLGVAKKKLTGEYEEPGMQKGNYSELMLKNKIIGYVVRTKDQVRPLFVSPGHLIDMHSATDIVLQTSLKHRLPEPTHLADKIIGQVVREKGK